MERLFKALELFKDNITIPIGDIIKNNLMDEIKFLINNEVLFYDVINGIIKPTSIIEWHAIKELINIYEKK